MQIIIDAQLFKENFKLSAESQYRPSLPFKDRAKNIKQKKIILTWMETVAYKLATRTKEE